MFKTQNFCHIASNNRNQVKAGVFVYRTTDDLATVSASGYFNERIIDINLHDLIIHEKINAADATKVQRNVLCVTERTLENVGVTVIKSKWEGDIEQEIADLKTYVDNNFVNIDGSSIMTGPLKMRSGSMQGAIAPYWNGIGLFKLGSNNNVTLLASMDDSYGFIPATTNTYNLGSSTYKWKDAYIGRVISGVLNNGANINVPTTGGTLGLNDFSNITDSAKNISNWSTNVTNCITEIPQDIKLELNSGTLTLKAGSKVYIPNGNNIFDVVTIASDITTTSAGSGSSDLFYFYSNGSFMARPVSDCFSGATQPTVTTTTAEWYDTTNNVIKHTADTGSTWTTPGTSFPLCICSRSSGSITGIKQVFNGFGFIGATIFALPGVKGLIPDGRNADGTLNNIEFTTSTVRTATDVSNSNNVLLVGSTLLARVTATNYFYDEEKNIIINKYSNTRVLGALYGTNTTTIGVISNFATKKVFRATDYNDYSKTAEQVETNTTNIATLSSTKQDKATALNYGNITNCITEIPQDINLTLSSGTLTLKAGSVLYKGDGSFTKVTLANDISISPTPTDGKRIVFTNASAYLDTVAVDAWISGSTEPTSGLLWFNTTDNKIYNGGPGNWAASSVCLALGIVTVSGNQIVSIDQVFNGFGFMGSTVFVLPGVKHLYARGRNTDGTLKSVSNTISSVLTRTELTAGTDPIGIGPNIGRGDYLYDFNSNFVYLNYISEANKRPNLIIAADMTTDATGRITYLKPKQPFAAVDYNDISNLNLKTSSFDLFDVKWSDHLINNTGWTRADSFSWQNGTTYSDAYDHLVNDISGKTLQSETIGGVTVQFYLADDGHKICPSAQESNVSSIYTAIGVAWYYILDTVNKRFKLPRVDANREILFSTASVALEATGSLQIKNSSDGLENVVKSASGDNAGRRQLVVDATSTGQNNSVEYGSGIAGTADLAGATGYYEGKKYLYFYVGKFTQTALEQTAGLNSSLFNGKADTNLMNTDSNVDIVIASQEPTALNDYTWYRKYKSGWVEQGGQFAQSGNNVSITLPVAMSDSNYLIVSGTEDRSDVQGWRYANRTTTGFTKNLIGTYDCAGSWIVMGKAA